MRNRDLEMRAVLACIEFDNLRKMHQVLTRQIGEAIHDYEQEQIQRRGLPPTYYHAHKVNLATADDSSAGRRAVTLIRQRKEVNKKIGACKRKIRAVARSAYNRNITFLENTEDE